MFIANKKMIKNAMSMKRFIQAVVKCSIAGVLYLMVQSSAWAVLKYCVNDSSRQPGDTPHQIVVPVVGELYVGNDFTAVTYISQLNSIIFRSPGFGYHCPRIDANDYSPVALTYFSRVEHLVTPLGGPSQLGVSIVKVYPTNIPGIGVSFVFNSGEYVPRDAVSSNTWICSNSRDCTQAPAYHTFTVQLHKTGDTPSGSYFVDATSFPTFSISTGTVEFPPLDHVVTVSFSGGINVMTQTCDIANVTVELGEHEKSYFDSNTATDWVDFNIELTNCPAFIGKSQAINWNISNPDNYTMGSYSRNKFMLMLKPTTTIVNASGVVALDGTSGSASGIGVQMQYNNSTSSSSIFNRSLSIDHIITSPGSIEGLNYTIPLKARYYRTGPASLVKPGTANTAVEFVISYQ